MGLDSGKLWRRPLFLAGSSIDTAYNQLPFNFQNNTWYRLVLSAAPNQGVRAAVLSDAGDGTGRGFLQAHGVRLSLRALRSVCPNSWGRLMSRPRCDVAVDYVSLTSWLAGEVNQAFFGDGIATRMIVPGCPALDLGLGRGFSIEGWINPFNVTNPAPLVEWFNTGRPTNQSPLGVQFWVALTNGPGSLAAILWDTNVSPMSSPLQRCPH